MQNSLTDRQITDFLKVLETRFHQNMPYHQDIVWDDVKERLLFNPSKLASVWMMNETGGEPDVVDFKLDANILTYVDCSKESPKDRYSLCYDHKALEERKKNKPINSACDLADEMGIELLDEMQYRHLQTIDKFDTKTSSWIKTPDEIRSLGGAIFCDRRYDTVFTYHNSAESYYSGRGFRGVLKI